MLDEQRDAKVSELRQRLGQATSEEEIVAVFNEAQAIEAQYHQEAHPFSDLVVEAWNKQGGHLGLENLG